MSIDLHLEKERNVHDDHDNHHDYHGHDSHDDHDDNVRHPNNHQNKHKRKGGVLGGLPPNVVLPNYILTLFSWASMVCLNSWHGWYARNNIINVQLCVCD